MVGASGLVGGRLLEHFQARPGYALRAVSRTRRAWPPGVEGCVADYHRPASVAAACLAVDAVVHLAVMNESAAAADPHGARIVAAEGASAWATAARDAGAPAFVQFSTFKVYGANLRGPVTELTPLAPAAPYAAAHAAAEASVARAGPAVVLRLSNGFGVPGPFAENAWSVIINEFCRQSVTERRITIRSAGSAWHNFIPLTDVARAAEAALSLPAGTYNLGAVESMTLKAAADHVARACGEVFGFEPPVQVGSRDATEPPVLDYRIDKLRAAGFSPGTLFAAEAGDVLRAARAVFGLTPA